MYGVGIYGNQVYGDLHAMFIEQLQLLAMNSILEGLERNGLSMITMLEAEARDTFAVTVDFDYGNIKNVAFFTGLEGNGLESLGMNTFLDYEKIASRVAVLSQLEKPELVNIAVKSLLEGLKRNGTSMISTLERNGYKSVAMDTLLDGNSKKSLAFITQIEGYLKRTLAFSTFLDHEKSNLVGIIALLESETNVRIAISSYLEADMHRNISITATLEGIGRALFAITTDLEAEKIRNISINTILENGVFGRFGIQPFELESNT